jgi:hypothetical protein
VQWARALRPLVETPPPVRLPFTPHTPCEKHGERRPTKKAKTLFLIASIQFQGSELTAQQQPSSKMAEVGVFLDDMAKLLTQFDVRIVRVKQSLKTAFHVDRKTRSGAS